MSSAINDLINAVEYLRTLLLRASLVMESAYACPEWLATGRTQESDETRRLVRLAVGLEEDQTHRGRKP